MSESSESTTSGTRNRRMSGCLVAFLTACLVGLLAITALVIFVAIPSYRNYAIQVQVSESTLLALDVKDAITAYHKQTGAFPASNTEAGLPAPRKISGKYVSQVAIGGTPGEFIVTFSSQTPQHADALIDGATMTYELAADQGAVEWRCHSETIRKEWCTYYCQCKPAAGADSR
jgi:type IV pilus assembly protein PilA